MRRATKIVVVIFTFAVVAWGIGAVSSLIFPIEKQGKTTTDPIALICSPGQEKSIHDALVKWVYDHSNRISRAGCEEIVSEAKKTDKTLLLLALIEAESNFVLSAVSNRGAMGLTQIMPGTWEKDLIAKGIIKERRDLFNTGPSISAGNHVLTINLKESKGNVTQALEKYLGGKDGVYVKRILSNLANLYVIMEQARL